MSILAFWTWSYGNGQLKWISFQLPLYIYRNLQSFYSLDMRKHPLTFGGGHLIHFSLSVSTQKKG